MIEVEGWRARGLGLPGAAAALFVFFAATAPGFASARNLSMLLIEVSTTAVLCVGMLLVIVPGRIDLAAGSGVGLTGGAAAVLAYRYGWPSWAAMAAAGATGVALWTGMGWLTASKRAPAFIATLGGLLTFKGVFWLIIGAGTIPVSREDGDGLYAGLATWYVPAAWGWVGAGAFAAAAAVWWRGRRGSEDEETSFLKAFVAVQGVCLLVLACNRHRGVPLAFVVLCATAGAAHAALHGTAFGRHLYAIGGNEKAAYLCGVPVRSRIVSAYAAMGAAVALTGFLQTSYAGASTVGVGELMELDAVAACVLGGTSLKGGRGTVAGALGGAAVMALLLNGMTLMAVAPEIKFIARGVALVVAVTTNRD